jgi:hypothetical protein
MSYCRTPKTWPAGTSGQRQCCLFTFFPHSCVGLYCCLGGLKEIRRLKELRLLNMVSNLQAFRVLAFIINRCELKAMHIIYRIDTAKNKKNSFIFLILFALYSIIAKYQPVGIEALRWQGNVNLWKNEVLLVYCYRTFY